LKAFFYKWYERIDNLFLMLCLGVMGIVLFTQVVTRYVLNMPLIWSEEAARYLHVWIALFGIHFGLRRNAHIRVTLFVDKLPRTARLAVEFATGLFLVGCIAIYLPGAYIFVADQANIKSSAMNLNMGFVYIPAIFGFVVALIHFAVTTVKSALDLIDALKGRPAC